MDNKNQFPTREQIRNTFMEAITPYLNFLVFVESLRRNDNNTLIESIQKGTNAIIEGELSVVVTNLLKEYIEGLSPRALIKYKAYNDDKLNRDVYNSCDNNTKNPGHIDRSNKELITMIWIFVYEEIIKFGQRYMGNFVKSGRDKSPIDMFKENVDLMADYILSPKINDKNETVYLNARDSSQHRPKDIIGSYDSKRGATFTTSVRNIIHSEKTKEITHIVLDKDNIKPWEPNTSYLIQKETNLTGLKYPVIRYKPGSYDSNTGEYLKDPKKINNESWVMYKRMIPPTQDKNFNKLNQYAVTSTQTNLTAIYSKDGEERFGRIDFAIPEKLRAYPPDSPKVKEYWIEKYTLEGRAGEHAKLNPSTEREGIDIQDEDSRTNRTITPDVGEAPSYNDMKEKQDPVFNKQIDEFINMAEDEFNAYIIDKTPVDATEQPIASILALKEVDIIEYFKSDTEKTRIKIIDDAMEGAQKKLDIVWNTNKLNNVKSKVRIHIKKIIDNIRKNAADII